MARLTTVASISRSLREMLESGELRPHVLCILNGESVQRDQVAATTLSDGDEIWIQQAISGG